MYIEQQCKTHDEEQIDYPIDEGMYQHQHPGSVPSIDIQSLRHQAKNFKILYDEYIKQPFFTQDTYWVVSAKWLRRWKKYVSYDESVSAAPPTKYIGRGILPIINQNIVKASAEFLTPFKDEYSYLNIALKQGLSEQKDYIFVNEEIWNFFDKYTQIEIKRNVVSSHEGKKVQMYFMEVTFVPIFSELLKSIEHEKCTKLPQIRLQVSHYSTIEKIGILITDILVKYIKDKNLLYHKSFAEGVPIQLWLLKQDTRINVLCNQLMTGCKANPSFTYKLICEGTFMQSSSCLYNYDILKTSLIMVQMRQQTQQAWIFWNSKKPFVGECNSCHSKSELKIACSCKFALYCSKKCQMDNKSSHKIRCPNDCESDQEQSELKYNEYSKNGLVGLRNLGNTCFMNSGLQCLSHVMQLTRYFLDDKYLAQINKNNPLGTGGQLSIAYGKMLKNLWMGNDTSFSPTILKRAIGKFQPMFMGYNQHDSGELVSFLLDGLHEDLNRIISKPYVQTKDYDGRADFLIARESWQNHLKRNQSIIVDLMFGQFKSIVDCPVCKYESIQFDPFLMCTLPLMNDNLKKIQVIFMKDHLNMIKQIILYDVNSNWKVNDMFEELKKKLNLPKNINLLAYISSDTVCEPVDQNAKLNDIRKEKLSYRKLVVRERFIEEDPENDVAIALAHVYCNSYYGNQSYRKNITPYYLWYFKRSASFKQVHHTIYEKYKQFYPLDDYFLDAINVEQKEQPFRLLAVQQWKYNSKCTYCGMKSCDGCVLPYDHSRKLEEFVTDERTKIDMEFFWRKNAENVKNKFDEVMEDAEKQVKVIRKNGTTIDECFRLFEEPEILGEDNAWYCPKCAQFVLAKKQMQIYKAPKILIVCLKRFKRKQYFSEKHNILVDFPIKGLNISKYVMNHNLPEQYFKNQNELNTQKDQLLYDLVGITNHFGGTGGGHYTAYCMDPDTEKWYDFDDSYVSELKSAYDAITQSAYMLYYRRRSA